MDPKQNVCLQAFDSADLCRDPVYQEAYHVVGS